MLTRENASAFVHGFDEATRIRWLALMLRYEWPDDMPFFAPPFLLQKYDSAFFKFRPPLTEAERNEVRADPVWSALHAALVGSLPVSISETLIATSYMLSVDAVTDAFVDYLGKDAVAAIVAAFQVMRFPLARSP